MEEFKVKALSFCPHPWSLWLRFVDDISVITKAKHSQPLLHHINNQDPHIQCTVEEPTQQSTLPFLGTLVTIEPNNTFSTTVYRKPIHTDQYLHWDSNHHITAKQSVYSTLAHRAKIVSSNQEILDKEFQHIRKALQTCQFPNWALNQLHQNFSRTINPTTTPETTMTPFKITIPTTPRTGTSPLESLTSRDQWKIQKAMQIWRYTSSFQGYK